MEVLSALRLPAGWKEFVDSGLVLHTPAVVAVETAVEGDVRSVGGKHTPFPTHRTLSDRRPKFAVAEGVLGVLVVIPLHAQRVYPLMARYNHPSHVELGLRYNLWMTEYTVFSARVVAYRCLLEPQLPRLLRPVMSVSGRRQALPVGLEIGALYLKLFLRLRELRTSRTAVSSVLALPFVLGRMICVNSLLEEGLRGLGMAEGCKMVAEEALAVLHRAEVSLKPWCWDYFSGYSSSL